MQLPWAPSLWAAFALAMVAFPSAAVAASDGLPAGKLIARPSVKLELLFDSNVYRDAAGAEAMDLGLSVRPEIQLLYDGENFKWDFGAHYRFFTFFGIRGTPHTDMRQVANFNVRTGIDANRRGKLGFSIKPEVYNQSAGRGYGDSPEQVFGAYVPLSFHIRPTGAFVISPGFSWHWSRAYWPELSIAQGAPTTLGERHELSGALGIEWRFFPRTFLVVSGDVGGNLWSPLAVTVQGSGQQINNVFWRVWAGIRGDLSRRVAMLAMVGYANAYYGRTNPGLKFTGVEGLLGKFELGLRPLITQRIGIGFSRDFKFRYYSNRIVDTAAYVNYRGLIADRLTLMADVTYVYRDLTGGATGLLDRTEHQLAAGAGLSVAITPFIHVGGNYRFSSVLQSSTGGGLYQDHRGMFEFMLGYPSTFASAVTP